MSLPELQDPEALRALGLFLAECAQDRTRADLPLRELVCAPEVDDFHSGMERLLRGLLVDYSLEKRARMIRESLRRSVQQQLFH